MTTTLPADQQARERIIESLDETLFVDAGAGTGKTKVLIDRVAATVLGGVPMAHIAAVTFTASAAAELRDRLRVRFEEAGRDGSQPALEALDALDGAAIGTLHSFALRILSEHPIEAGLPPLVEVLDEVASGVAFDERWGEQYRALLDDDGLGETMLFAFAAGVTQDDLRSLALKFTSDWDLVADRVLAAEPPGSPSLPDTTALASEAHRLADQDCFCTNTDDRLSARLAKLRDWGGRLSGAPDPAARLQVLNEIVDAKFGNTGNAKNWPRFDLNRLRGECGELVKQAKLVVEQTAHETLRSLGYRIAKLVLESARARQADGKLEYHDLLVLSRQLLRSNSEVRAALAERYQRLLLDEFQDSDPIQIELAVRIASGAPASERDWADVTVPPGRLFVVGDPKQSIYRFRRADIATYLRAKAVFGESPSLTTNFRTVGPVVAWVNGVFSRLIQLDQGSQPAYEPLDAFRDPPPDGPAVVALGAEAHAEKLNADGLRDREAADVAGVIRRALAEGWQVRDERTREWRAAGLGDIVVLVPSRTSVAQLQQALDASGVPYETHASSIVYQAQQVRDLLAAARAVDDPSDALALVTALRSPLFGCGDDDLWTWRQGGGAFNLFTSIVGREDHPVARGLDYLRRLHNRAKWLPPSELLGALVADRRMLETAADSRRARDRWRQLRFVVDHARAWSETEHGSLREYLAWASRQGDEKARVAEALPPETDTDAVRIMTIHAAKGLEFPIVIVSGMTSGSRGARGVQVLWPAAGGYELKLRKGVQTGDFDAALPIDEQMDNDERVRLLYVACTRARDHLVVSMHRCGGAKTNAALLADASSGVDAEPFHAEPFDAAASGGPVAPARFEVVGAEAGQPPDWDRWLAGMTSVRERSRRASSISASGLEGTDLLRRRDDTPIDPGLAKDARNLELPPWYVGRFGTAIGRAVHAVLQEVDLGTGAGLDNAVAAQALAEGVVEHGSLVHALVESALSSGIVQRAASLAHWKETYVGTVVPGEYLAPLATALDRHVGGDDCVLEGFVDLLYRDEDGLVVVDYKTDAVPHGAIGARVDVYRPQLAAYARAVSDATGEAVARRVLLFLRPEGALERDV